MATSMVKGNPMKLMLQFAFPLLIGNLLQQTCLLYTSPSPRD